MEASFGAFSSVANIVFFYYDQQADAAIAEGVLQLPVGPLQDGGKLAFMLGLSVPQRLRPERC